MISRTLEIIRENWLFYTVYLIAAVVYKDLNQLILMNFGSRGLVALPLSFLMIILQALLALSIFRRALFGIPFSELPPGTSRFSGLFALVVKTGVLFAVSSIPAVILFFLAKHLGFISKAHNVGLWLTASAGAAFLLGSSLVFSYAGTWLPASVFDGDLSLSSAISRGNVTFRKIFFRLAAMMLVTSCLTLALSFGPKILNLASKDNGFSQIILVTAMGCLAGLLEIFYLTFTAVILSHYYLWSEDSVNCAPEPIVDVV